MRESIRYYLNLFKSGTKKLFKEFFVKETNKKQRANMWTFSRLIIPFVTVISSIFAIVTNTLPLFILSGAVAGAGALTDFFDGRSSRKHESQSEYGKILDQVSDKFFSAIIGINLLFINFNYIILLLGELAIAITNITYKLKHPELNINSTKIGKIKEWPLYLSLAFGYLSAINPVLFTVSNITIAIAIATQCATVLSYIKSNNEEVKKLKKEQKKADIMDPVNTNAEKEKVLVKEYVGNENSKTSSKLEQYKNLRSLLNEAITNDQSKSNENDKTQQDSKEKILKK